MALKTNENDLHKNYEYGNMRLWTSMAFLYDRYRDLWRIWSFTTKFEPEKFENNWDRNPGPKKNRLKFDPNSEYDIRWDFYIFENSIAG